MSEWGLVALLVLFTLIASLLILYPLRRQALICGLLIPVIFGMVFGGYYSWGGFPQWQNHIHQKQSEQRAQQMLQSIKNPQELVEKLRSRLDDSPESAKGWYLLGRVYSSQNDHQNARKAFATAHHLKPNNEQFAVNYAHSLWMVNKQQFNPEILDLFKSLLVNNPNQPDALAMLAMNAFVSKAYKEAIDYWQRLLKITPEQSDAAFAIRKAIAKAQLRIKKN